MLVGARAQVLSKARAWININTEVRARMIAEAFTDDLRSKFMDISSKIKGVSNTSTSVQGSTCPYISTKGMGVRRVTSTDISKRKTVVQEITNVYD